MLTIRLKIFKKHERWQFYIAIISDILITFGFNIFSFLSQSIAVEFATIGWGRDIKVNLDDQCYILVTGKRML